MIQKDNIAALILAGGQSSRMGQDKALLSWEGQPFLLRVCQVAAALTSQVYILTPWCDRYQAVLADCYQSIRELNPGQGPLVAFAQGLTEIQSEWILLLACDLPLLQVDILKKWMMQLNQVPDSILAVVPHQESGWEPLCGFYRQTALPPLQDFIEAGGRSFQKWLSQIPTLPLSVGQPELQMLANCNTPEEFVKLKTNQ